VTLKITGPHKAVAKKLGSPILIFSVGQHYPLGLSPGHHFDNTLAIHLPQRLRNNTFRSSNVAGDLASITLPPLNYEGQNLSLVIPRYENFGQSNLG